MTGHILTLNAGSSSVKFAVFSDDPKPECLWRGQVEGLGETPVLSMEDDDPAHNIRRELDPLKTIDATAALDEIFAIIAERAPETGLRAIGHRVVHGGIDHTGPALLDGAIFRQLETLSPFAPLHQPHNLAGVKAAHRAYPGVPQIACFDTAFHRSHPWVNDTFALPRELYRKGVRRYGFHGLSYEYICHEMKLSAPHHHRGGVVIAHLGNGASMTAVRGGHSVGSTMGFSALDGLPMGTRCGQLDPGVVLYLMDQEGMGAEEILHMLYRESGLKGLSGLTHDMRTLQASSEPEAMQAIDYYIFRIRRELGAMTAVLNGLDALVFCGGIGENAWQIRERVCDDMDWLGLELDETRNRANARIISSDRSRVRLFVIPTDEEWIIAHHSVSILASLGETRFEQKPD